MKVIVSAYACEPGKGSEPGAGWNWVVAAARRHEVCVLTRSNNREPIEAALAARPLPSLRLVYLDLPGWARFWKRGGHGVRVYYALWQVLAAREARRLCAQEHFDVVHHLTFANIWLPALACLAGPPFVLGPVAGGQHVPAPLFPALGPRGAALELLLSLRALNRFNPLVRVAWRRSAVILAMNHETLHALPREARRKTRLRGHSCADLGPLPRHGPPGDAPVAACVGRLHRFKGVELAIRALRFAPDWRLLVLGDGPERERLQRLAEQEGVTSRVEFVGRVPQADAWRRLARCDALLLPTLKEGGSMIAAEAQMLGVPVVALAANGPAVLAEMDGAHFELVRPGRPAAVARGFAAALERLRTAAPPAAPCDFGLDGVERDVDAVYRAAAREAAA